MTDPYRDPEGAPCPRCGGVLVADDRKDLVCSCGTFIVAASLAKLVGRVKINGSPGVAYWKADPLPASRCPSCRNQLEDLYLTLGERVISCGRCEHGLWLEHAVRADFERAYASQIDQHAHGKRLRESGPEGESERADRIEALEARVAALENQLATLATRSGWTTNGT